MADRKMNLIKTTMTTFMTLKSLHFGALISKLRGVILVATMLFVSTDLAALGLGSLEIKSNLDQPLNGVIELRANDGEDVSSVKASIASREEFDSLGIDYPDYLKDITLNIEQSNDGAQLVINSNGVIIKEPFIHFLVKVEWPGGSFLREYTALVDPPVYASEAPKSIAQPREVGTDLAYDDQVSGADIAEEEPLIEDNFYEEPSAEDVVIDQAPLASNDNQQGTDARYGPVASGESLSVIAQDLQRQFPDLSIYQIMKVLFEENKSAFINENINGLIKGTILNIADLGTIRAVDVAEGKAFYLAQIAEWDPSVLSSSSDSSLRVGQDEYTAGNDDVFSDDASGADSGSTSDDSFQVGASTETNDFVSSDQGQSSDGEVLALRQELSELQSSLASSELENQELTERISALEGQLADMNSLLELRVEDADLASLESNLAAQNAADDVTQAIDDGAEIVDELGDSAADFAEEGLLAEGAADQEGIDEFLADAFGDEAVETDLTEELEDDNVDAFSEEGLSALDEFSDDAEVAGVDSDGVDYSSDGLVDEDIGFADEPVEAELDAAIDDGVESAAAPVTVTTPEKQSIVDKIKSALFGGDWWKILAGVGGLLLAGLAVLFWRNRRADEEFEISMLSIESNSQNIEDFQTASMSASISTSTSTSKVATVSEKAPDGEGADKETSFLTVYSDSDAVVQADEVDPIAEADVYIAYGRDEQAEEVLLDGVASHPDRIDIKHKLLELYHKTKNVENYERVAEEIYSQRDQMSSEGWQAVCQMGKELDSDNPLFSLSSEDLAAASDVIDAAEENSVVELAQDAAVDDVDADVASSDIEDTSESLVSSLDDDSIHVINADDQHSEVSELDEVEIDALELDSEVSHDLIDVPTESLAAVDNVVEIDALDDQSIDFNIDDAAAPLDIEAEQAGSDVGEVQEVSDLEIDPDYDEARTQYELAKVFVDLGDEDGARKILNDLVANDDNDVAVLDDAKALLDSINS